MNYYYPYIASVPARSTTGIFSKIFGGIKFSSILSGTQKTLSIVNQTIPLVKQASPIIKNAKSMFKLMNEFKKVDTPEVKENNQSTSNIKEKEEVITSSGPTFFL